MIEELTLPDSRPLDPLQSERDGLASLSTVDGNTFPLNRLDDGRNEGTQAVGSKEYCVSNSDGSAREEEGQPCSAYGHETSRAHPARITPDTTAPTNGTENTSETENSKSALTGNVLSVEVGTRLRKVRRRSSRSPVTLETEEAVESQIGVIKHR